MKIAIYNGHQYHHDVYGHVLHFCKSNNHEIFIYTIVVDEFGWYNWFSQNGLSFTLVHINKFVEELPELGIAFIITETDFTFPDIPRHLRHKIVTITHWDFPTMPYFKNIPIRPFKHEKFHVLPIYPYFIKATKRFSDVDGNIHIGIIGGVKEKYNVALMNLISPHLQSDKTYQNIIFHIISRRIDPESYEGCERRVITYESIPTKIMMGVVASMDYILLDAADPDVKLTEKKQITSSLIVAWDLLIPIIISNKMNKHYGFKNCIVYKKHGGLNVILHKIDLQDLIDERATFPTIQSALEQKYPELLQLN